MLLKRNKDHEYQQSQEDQQDRDLLSLIFLMKDKTRSCQIHPDHLVTSAWIAMPFYTGALLKLRIRECRG